MSGDWLLIAGCAASTSALKAVGPIALAGRRLPDRLTHVVALLAPALLAALVVTHTVANGRSLTLGADTGGVLAAGAVLLVSRSVLLSASAAALVTALIRAVG